MLIIVGSIGSVVLAMYVVQVTADDSGQLDLDQVKLAETTILYDGTDAHAEYSTFSGDSNRIWVSLDTIPAGLQQAVIAIEDKDFMTEPGINIKRTIGAAVNEFTNNALYGRRQGASTIEQQLVKNLTGDDQQDSMRKVREIFRALGLAKRYSKETVLEAYLNTISLTGTIAGVQSAANTYFGKDVSDLSLAECATLACITKNPTGYNPYTNPENLLVRRNYCLGLMRDQGYITADACTAAQAEPMTLTEKKAATENSTVTSNNSYFTDAVYDQLKKDLVDVGYATTEDVASVIHSGGLRVYTTVDPTLQKQLEEIMLNTDDSYFPALEHDEEVDSKIPVNTEITYDDNGLPLNPDGSAIFGTNAVPVYKDAANTEFKTTTTKSGDSEFVTFYQKVRTQAAMATLDYSGNVLAVVGGVGQKQYDRVFNRATEPHQTGSTMKPIGAYCLGIQSGAITYSSLVPDAPLYAKADKKVLNEDYCRRLGLSLDPFNANNLARDDVWKDWPTNYDGSFSNEAVPVYMALEKSLNTVAVRVGSYVGVDYIYNFVHDTLNCQSLVEQDADYAPIVLGAQSYGISCVELAGAFSIFNDGSFTTPHYYTEVYDSQGNLILDNTKRITTTQALNTETAVIMNRLLRNVLTDTYGTAKGMTPNTPANLPAAAKTGTTSDFKDYTFCGLTPYYVTAGWWGFDKPTDMSQFGYKSGKPLQVAWKALMEQAQADLPYKDFATSDNVLEKNFDPTTGSIVASGGKVGYYTADNLPQDTQTTDDAAYQQAAQDAADQATSAAG